MIRALLTILLLSSIAGPIARAQDESPVVRFSILPSVRGPADQFDGGDDRTAQTTVLAALTYTGTEPVEGCWITDSSHSYFAPHPPFPMLPPSAAVWVDHREIDSAGNFLADWTEEFDMAPGQTRFFVLGAANADCESSTCFAVPRLNCADPNGAEGRHNALQLNSRGLPVEQFQINIRPRPMADIIPVMVTPSGDGFLRIANEGGVAAAAVAAVNIGASSEITVVATASGGAAADVCETDGNGQCLGPRANSIRVQMDRDAIHLFSVRVRDDASFSLPRAPANRRVFLRFIEERRGDHSLAWTLVGDASTAIDEPASAQPAPSDLVGVWRFDRCLNERRTVRYSHPGDATSGDRILIGSNRLALIAARGLHGNDLCSSSSPVRLVRLNSVDQPGQGEITGQNLGYASTDYTGDWNTSGYSGARSNFTVTSDDDGDTLSFAGQIFSGAVDPYDETEPTPHAVRDFNTAFLPSPIGEFAINEVINDAQLAIVVSIDEALTLTTIQTNGCEFSGRLTPEAGRPGAAGLHQIALNVRNCPAPIVNLNGALQGLILVEQTEDGLVWAGGAYKESTFDGRRFFLLRARQVTD